MICPIGEEIRLHTWNDRILFQSTCFLNFILIFKTAFREWRLAGLAVQNTVKCRGSRVARHTSLDGWRGLEKMELNEPRRQKSGRIPAGSKRSMENFILTYSRFKTIDSSRVLGFLRPWYPTEGDVWGRISYQENKCIETCEMHLRSRVACSLTPRYVSMSRLYFFQF